MALVGSFPASTSTRGYHLEIGGGNGGKTGAGEFSEGLFPKCCNIRLRASFRIADNPGNTSFPDTAAFSDTDFGRPGQFLAQDLGRGTDRPGH
jgi:hypothetical protein